jgi:hypothetical protein
MSLNTYVLAHYLYLISGTNFGCDRLYIQRKRYIFTSFQFNFPFPYARTGLEPSSFTSEADAMTTAPRRNGPVSPTLHLY